MPLLSYDKRKSLYQIYEYSTNVISILGTPEKSWSDKEGNVNIFGVELEASTDYEPQNIIDAFPDIFAICKKDSTVTGEKTYPIEIVTIPASLKRHKKMWSAFFKNIDRDKFDTLDKHTNGMHVHIDRNSFESDGLHLKKFCFLMSSKDLQEFNIAISERTKDAIDKWSKFVTKATSIVNIERYTRELSKYAVVNLGKAATVEVRLFKGVISFTSVIKNLEFTDAILEFTRTASITQINLVSFLKWLSELPSSRYRTLRLCITEIDLEEMYFHSNLTTFLKKERDPLKAFKKLRTNQVTFEARFYKKVISAFNEKFSRYKLSYDQQGGWAIEKITTKFAKFDDITLKMFR